MNQRCLAVVCAVLFGVAALASCDKSAPPPAPKAEAPKAEPATAAAPAIDDAVKRLTAEVYVYAYPLVLTDVTREADTASVPMDTFRHSSTLPDASSTNAASPNADFLYSRAWLDLSKGPVLLSAPDTRGRYYLIAMLDAWTNVASSLGKRSTGTEKGDFAIVGPHWKGKLPGGVSEVRSPTDLAWLFGRVQTTGGADRDAAIKIQSAFKLTAMDRPKPSAKSTPARPAGDGTTTAAPRDQVDAMDAATFFTRFALLLPANPPADADAPMREKIKKLGIEAGQPFEPGKLDPVAASGVAEGAKSGLAAIAGAAKNGTGGDIRNGWIFDLALGRWGNDYGKRAVAAYNGLGLNAPEDAIFMATHLDAGGRRLDGANRYVLHFDNGKAPPADGFWSLSLYDDRQHFVANPINRYNIESSSRPKTNSDGSVDIYIQNADPGADKASNWLPAPKEGFNLILRIYWPKQEVIDGKWVAPGVKPLA
jgi:hypothetical protein